MKQIQLSDHFTYNKLIRFVLPSVGMMIFTSIYGVVDGFFLSNYAGSMAFAGVNLILPFIYFFSSIGFMIGTGGTALVSKYLGMGEKKRANEYFSLLVYLIIAIGIILMTVGEIFMPQVVQLLGATEAMAPYCIQYGRISLLTITAFMLQTMFQSFLVVAEKPKLGFLITVMAGMTNIVLDIILVGALDMGVVGAALATGISELVGGIIPLIYFAMPNSGLLRLCKTKIHLQAIGKSCSNGISEFLTNVSVSLVNMLYNIQLMKFIGETGVAAYGVIMYVNFIFIAIFIGYSMGTAPVEAYNYGAKNHSELRNVWIKSLIIIGILAVALTVLAECFAGLLASIFVGYDPTLLALTTKAFRIYAIAYLIMGFNIYGSSFFTAMNNGLVSGAMSLLRTLILQVICIMLLPKLLGMDGIWLSIIIAEGLSVIITIICWIYFRGRYHYGRAL